MERKNKLLKTAISNFVKAQPPNRMLVGLADTQEWFKEHGIVYPTRWTAEGHAIGFRKDGYEAIISLVDELIKEHSEYSRATSFDRLTAAIADELIESILHGEVSDNYLHVTDKIAKWIASETIQKKHYIPCTITPYDSTPFNVGPVIFRPLNNFKSIKITGEKDELERFSYGKLFEFATEEKANWIAEVQIEGYDHSRSSELADVSVDLALSVLQIIIPSSISREISRVTARTVPALSGSYVEVDNYLRCGFTRQDPCLSYSAEYFNDLIRRNRAILDSVGLRVHAYLTNESALPRLEQAWCDAAYWFHEGISERLDTIAITKMETAMEVLLCSESTKSSKDGLYRAVKVIYGLDKNEQISSSDSRTVKQFIEGIVESRSRILHGTWSTLTHRPKTRNEHQYRQEVEYIARDLLAQFTMKLDDYVKIEGADDHSRKFLEWILTQNENESVSS